VPPLAGLPSLTEEQAERVLEQGVGPEGEALRQPMHIYRMNLADAKAIVAYLKSLPTAWVKQGKPRQKLPGCSRGAAHGL